MLEEMGVATGVDLPKLIAASAEAQKVARAPARCPRPDCRAGGLAPQ